MVSVLFEVEAKSPGGLIYYDIMIMLGVVPRPSCRAAMIIMIIPTITRWAQLRCASRMRSGCNTQVKRKPSLIHELTEETRDSVWISLKKG